MADISQYLADIMAAVYGEDVRGSIHDAIEIINDVGEKVLTTGTAVVGPSSSSSGFFDDSLYLNTNTMELWKCVGTDSWASQGSLQGDPGTPGADGDGIDDIQKTATAGLVDTYTIYMTDGVTTYDFYVTNGTNGNKWYRGTNISGKSVNPTVYSSSGITNANPNDFYLNPTEGAIYYCVTGGDASTATWSYDFTMTGGGGGGGTSDYNDLTNKPSIGGTTLAGSLTLADLGAAASADLATVATTGAYSDLSGKPSLATVATSGAYSDLTGRPSLATVATTGSYSDLSGKPSLATVATSGAYSDLTGKPTIPTISIAGEGTASSSATHAQKIDISGTKTAIDGSVYMEYTASSSTFTFTNTAITADSVIDVYTNTWGDNPTSVTVSAGSCSVAFSASQSRTVRIYIR